MEFEERYFREELDYLRQLSKLLATEKPHLARFLAEKDADPDIERLLEGVAFLTGNLRQKIEDEFPELTHGLIKMLWPNYLRPVPAMTLIEYTPDMDKSSVPVLIPRNEQFTTNAGEIRVDEVLPSDAKKEEPPPCTFTLCRDIWLRRDSLRLYCAPAINLFIHHAEAITLDNRRADYPLVPSRHYPQHYDVFSVNSVVSQVQDMFRKKDLGRPVSTQAARQWPAFESFSHQMEYSRKREVVYWHHRTKTSLFHRGFDHTLAFIHADGSYPSDESLLSNEVVSVSLTCTNRELPSQIRSGDITGTTGKNAAVASFRNITRPTQPLWPVIDGSLHWSLLSAMNLNYLSLLDTDALKQVIANFDRHAIHHPQTARLSQQKLDAIERLETRPVDRLFTGIPVRGLASTLYLHPEPFVCEGEMYLLGTVLSHFLSLYASVNSFHMLTVVNTESQETWKWTERIGQHPLI
ncbi:type VI secretion system baseplate subunit TssF [Escherichia coli]|uniref:type VI secretion system baseplate subunit TssF n=1 Tax=Escherichia coli TaxID=562 RepID=UPI001D5835EE|nr:type VI secretion system baseplate subunit TssF [Escherichia coli]EEU3471250.1 type VI secretion system baseplate subunit TssF [Escherichia coli]MDG5937609.1 type VI secretion system baseplate subunit TssF [Escherichia coli]